MGKIQGSPAHLNACGRYQPVAAPLNWCRRPRSLTMPPQRGVREGTYRLGPQVRGRRPAQTELLLMFTHLKPSKVRVENRATITKELQ